MRTALAKRLDVVDRGRFTTAHPAAVPPVSKLRSQQLRRDRPDGVGLQKCLAATPTLSALLWMSLCVFLGSLFASFRVGSVVPTIPFADDMRILKMMLPLTGSVPLLILRLPAVRLLLEVIRILGIATLMPLLLIVPLT